jgi:hypothetical protein
MEEAGNFAPWVVERPLQAQKPVTIEVDAEKDE